MARFERQRSRKVDKATGVRYDQIVRIHGKIAAKRYPEKLRRIKFYDAENDRRIMFLTNDFDQPAETIAALYKRRWQVELFFKWIKQNLHVKKFFGQTENAVRIQIWVAICTYTLLLILKRENKSDVRISQMLHFFTNVPFEEMPLKRAFDAIPEKFADQECAKQLFLPGF